MKKLCVLLAAVVGLLPLPQAFSMPIENVEVQVIDARYGTSAPLLEKMNSSMQVVADQLLLDKDTESIAAASSDYERLFGEIGDRVFTGYELQSVSLQPGRVTRLYMYLRPWGTTIRGVKVDLQFSGVEPATAAMLKQSLPTLKQELQGIIEGASVDAVDWAGSILRKRVRTRVEQELPDFKAAVDLVQEGKADEALVQVVIYPVGQSVRAVRYEMHSESIPNLLLMQLKYKYAGRCNELRGLPVAYVKSHKQELQEILEQELKAEKIVKEFDLHPKVRLVPGSDTEVDISLPTHKYKIWVEGYADLGRNNDNISGKIHAGKYVSKDGEFFVEEELITDHVHWNTYLGYAQDWGKSTWSFRKRLPMGDNVYKLEYHLGPKWGLRLEHYSGNDRNEYALRYRIHEFLSCEYVYGGKESYFRLIGNL